MNRAARAYVRAGVKALGAVAGVEEERLVPLDRSQLMPEALDLGGRYETGERADFPKNPRSRLEQWAGRSQDSYERTCLDAPGRGTLRAKQATQHICTEPGVLWSYLGNWLGPPRRRCPFRCVNLEQNIAPSSAREVTPTRADSVRQRCQGLCRS
jgi:hypothetical protein